MHLKNILLSLLLLHVTLAPVTTADAGSRGRTIADTMIDMMDAMGRFSRDYVDSRDRDQDTFSQAWEAMAPDGGLPGWPRAPHPSGQSLRQAIPGEPPPGFSTKTPLEGDWLSPTGERLSIRGSRFRLAAGPDRRLEGLLQIRGRLLALYSPKHRQTWFYEYAEQEGRLALRSDQGQLLLYRRVNPRDGGPPERRR